MSLSISYKIEAIDEFSNVFSNLEKQMKNIDNVAGDFKKVGAGMTAAGVGLATGLGAAIKTGMDFDQQMSGVRAISGATEEEFKALREAALQLGSSTSKSASEAANGMKELAAMGFDVNDILSAMPGVIAASEASGADMAQVASVMASTLNAFGMEASEAANVADILAQTATLSAADITDMQYALKYAAGPANALGISLEELSASVGIMVDAGASGEQAGTTLRAALLRLVDPPNEAATALQQLGISVTDAQGNFKPMGQIIGEFQTALDGMTNAQKAATLSTIFGTEAVTGMLNLISAGPERFNEMTTALQNSAGASAEASRIMKDNLAGSLEELDGAFETAAVKISDALTPAIRWMTDNITAAVNWFNNLDGTTQKVIITVAALTAGIALIGGPMLLLIGYIPQIVSGFNSIITVTSALGKTFTFLVTNPIGLILAAIAGIIAAGILLYQHWDDVKKYARDTWDSISSFFNDTWNAIKQKASDIWNGVKSFFSDNFSAMKTQITDTWRSIKTFLTDTWTGLKNAVSAPFTTIRNTLSDVWNTITSNVESAWNSIGNTIKGAVNGVIGAINKFINGVNGIEISVPSVDIPLVGKVGGFKIGLPKIPNIPMLDTGTNYVASDGLAYIHKGEAVIPKAYNPAAGGGYGEGIIINVNAAYVDREAVSRLATEINRELGRRVGGKR